MKQERKGSNIPKYLRILIPSILLVVWFAVASIVLAATFAALAVIPILFLAQLAFVVAFGVLLDTIIVRSLLVPALVHDIGHRVWWPSKKHKD
jgi:uncharacterized membrane protein YdfJ with MMPL/SSD domain